MAKAVDSSSRFAPASAAPDRRVAHYSNLVFADGRVDASILCRIANGKVKSNRDGQTRSEIFRGLWLMIKLMQSAILEERKRQALPIHEQQARALELEIYLLGQKRLASATGDHRRYFDQQIAWRRERIAELRAPMARAA